MSAWALGFDADNLDLNPDQDFDSLCFQVSDDDAAERAQPVRALTDGEQDETAYDWAHPWPVDRRTTTMSLEVWMAHEALVAQVLSRREGWSANDWTRWSWSDVRYVGVDVDGRRYPDVFAECTPYVTDEEPACTIRARFDVATQRLVEFEAS